MKKKNIIIMSICFIVIIIVSFIGFNWINSSNAEKMNRMAKIAIEKGEYQKAIDIYSSLYDKTKEEKYIDKKRTAVEFLSSKNNYENGVKYLNQSKYMEATRSFLRVKPEDKINFEKSKQRLEEINQKLIITADSLSEDNNYDASLNMLNDYLKVKPKEKLISEKILEIKKLKKAYDNKKKEEEKIKALSEKKEEEARRKVEKLVEESSKEIKQKQKKITEEKKSPKVKTEIEKMIELSINLVGKTLLVTSDTADLYDLPDKNGEIISSVPIGSEVYIYEAKPDGANRVWCHAIIKSAESLKSYDAWISSNNLEQND